MPHAGRNLSRIGEPHRRAHFGGDGFGEFWKALLDASSDLFQQFGAVFHAGLRKGREGSLGGGDSLVDIG